MRIGMGDIAREGQGVARFGSMRFSIDLNYQRPGMNVQQLTGAWGMSLAAVRLTRPQSPLPQLYNARRLGVCDQHAAATVLTLPKHSACARRGQFHLRGGWLHQRRESHTKCLAQFQQRAQAGIRGTLFNVDEHPPANAGGITELIKRPVPIQPLSSDSGSDRFSYGVTVLHHKCILMHIGCIARAPLPKVDGSNMSQEVSQRASYEVLRDRIRSVSVSREPHETRGERMKHQVRRRLRC
ncbi:hypothetical protein JOF45_001283 [Nesterenkonia lacusekhoensis]|uniref:Uncharacterized protein n=1 Tax=Nesterenkonia lacusekhoensis TaxID=150832 RepID=A0ABS4T2L9_9MICC|nr:hypothetical protein [Nesterenkonia lacusekhoensis]